MGRGFNSVMLPQLSSPVSGLKRVFRRLLQVLCVLLTVVSLTACTGSQPPRALLNEALVLQIQLTQSAIASSLDLTPMPTAPSVSRVRVEDQESFALGDEHRIATGGIALVQKSLSGTRERAAQLLLPHHTRCEIA